MSDTYRAGDEDFDWLRARFMDMVRRHLSDCEPTPSKKGKKKPQPMKPAAKEPIVIDGRPVEVERYGDGTKDTRRNNAADALEWLMMKGHLNSRIVGDRTEKAMEIAWAEGRGRINTATRLAAIFEKAELTPLRSPDFEAVPGGSFGARHIGASKFQCIAILADLGEDIPPSCMEILRAIICRNEFPWHGAGKRDEQRIMEQIRMALDFASYSLDRHHPRPEMTEDELVRRWPEAAEWFTAKRLRAATLSFKRDRVG